MKTPSKIKLFVSHYRRASCSFEPLKERIVLGAFTDKRIYAEGKTFDRATGKEITSFHGSPYSIRAEIIV